ncbi:MAG: FAD-dependent oxidoreductase [Magnetospiraceae bacterium]
MTDLTLAHDLAFEDLYSREGLVRIDGLFLESLAPDLRAQLDAARAAPGSLSRKDSADLMEALGPPAERFIGDLFGVLDKLDAETATIRGHDVLFECKRNFVQRLAAKKVKPGDVTEDEGAALAADLEHRFGAPLTEETFAAQVMAWEEDPETHAASTAVALRYAGWALHTQTGRMKHKAGVLFKTPHPVDAANLVPVETESFNGVDTLIHPKDHDRYLRDGFSLTDFGCDTTEALDQAHYCVICHDRGRDSCSRGFFEKKGDGFQKNPQGVPLTGCPLEERISEMHRLFKGGYSLGALAMICVDNPMVAGTGHRICNDCMKACIYQKQEPVNIPQVETRVLKNILELPWGFEIYSLLTRWNPLNLERPYPRAETGYKVLVVGLGPAGYTLAHHLMNDGHAVAALDGLKIEPLDPSLGGVGLDGSRVPFAPIQDIHSQFDDLDTRLMEGFGGVAEYGITVRWDKNFLRIIRLLLERRAQFAMYGGVRFGGAITAEDAFDMGFDHVALCVGAGKPNILSDIPNGLARGVRTASDFLMGLQLTGAAKKDTVTNLQLRLPVVVIGGGLTAMDTATEALAYYARQVEKFAERYDRLAAAGRAEALQAAWNTEEAEIAAEFLDHGRAIQAERKAAAAAGRQPDFAPLLDQWGGSILAYRRQLSAAPSYRLNHEEISKALEQGVRVAELLGPKAVEVDQYGHAKALKLERMALVDGRPKGTGEEVTLPARTILVATGTRPNVTLAREYPGLMDMEGDYYRLFDLDGNAHAPDWSKKPKDLQVLTAPRVEGSRMSFFGDLHPSFAGNVVSAMASAKVGYPLVDAALAKRAPSAISADLLFTQLNDGLRAVVTEVIRLTPTIVEVVVRAPLAAKTFRPGQFFRLMNFESQAAHAQDTDLLMEGLALTGAWVDVEKGLVSVIVLEMGGSSDLCAVLKPGEPVVLMGPTGTPTETPSGETVLLVGGGLGNAVLFSIGQALRAAGSRVLYVGGYKKIIDRYHVENIHEAGDVVIWACDEAPGFTPERPQDRAITANIVEAIIAYGQGELGDIHIPLNEVDRIIAIGSDRMMRAVAEARHGVLKPLLKADHQAIGSINSPMQCMMKEICGQCLQRHVDPVTGAESVVFSCFNQDQGLDHVDFGNLNARLAQNGVQEKLTGQWIAHCLETVGKRI